MVLYIRACVNCAGFQKERLYACRRGAPHLESDPCHNDADSQTSAQQPHHTAPVHATCILCICLSYDPRFRSGPSGPMRINSTTDWQDQRPGSMPAQPLPGVPGCWSLELDPCKPRVPRRHGDAFAPRCLFRRRRQGPEILESKQKVTIEYRVCDICARS